MSSFRQMYDPPTTTSPMETREKPQVPNGNHHDELPQHNATERAQPRFEFVLLIGGPNLDSTCMDSTPWHEKGAYETHYKNHPYRPGGRKYPMYHRVDSPEPPGGRVSRCKCS